MKLQRQKMKKYKLTRTKNILKSKFNKKKT